jgi:putative redox protein
MGLYKVDITNSGTSQFNVKSKDYSFIIDTQGQGVTPPDALLASLGSCIGVYLKKYLDNGKMAYSGFSISVEAEFRKDAPVGFDIIKILVDVRGAEIEDRRRQAIMDFIRNCPVHNTLELKPDIRIEITYN